MQQVRFGLSLDGQRGWHLRDALGEPVVGPLGKGIGCLHRRGPNVAMADSACRRLNPKISRETLRSLFDPNDGKVIDARDAFEE